MTYLPRILALLVATSAVVLGPAGPDVQPQLVAEHITPAGSSTCLNVPVSSAIVHPTSCWVTGSTSIVVAGTAARHPQDGEVILVTEQMRRGITLPGAGALHINSIQNGLACIQATSGRTTGIDITTGQTTASCEKPTTPAPHPTSGNVSRTTPLAPTTALAPSSAPTPSSSFYVYGSYVNVCGLAATNGCPIYNDGANEVVPTTGGISVIDFGAPCFEPSTLAWGTQLFNSQSCTPDSTLVTLAQAWLRGYQTNPNRTTSPQYILAAGTSNSLTAAVPGNALTHAQMSEHGQAWFGSVVSPIATVAAGLGTPVTIWSGNDIEESSDGNWYDAPTTGPWVDGYAAASGATKPCVSTRPAMMVDFGDYVPNMPGWSAGGVYHVSWGAAPACPMPEIYYTANATEWNSLNNYAKSIGLAGMQFTAVMSENGASSSLSAAGSWNALQNATGQAAPYLTVIGSSGAGSGEVPDPPTSVTAVPGAASATVAWSPPAWDGGSKVTGYTVTAYAGITAAQTVVLSGWPVPETAVVHGLTNGTAYTFMVSARNAVGTGPQSLASAAVTPNELLPYTTASTSHYQLTGNDGAAWVDLDSTALSLSVTPSVSGQASISASADLFTGTAGINQDLGIDVNGTIAAWKESGGAAAFAPTAATVDVVIPVTAGTPYTVKLRWKTNKSAPGKTIYVGAGPVGSQYSPTRLTLRLVPTAANLKSGVTTGLPALANSDGSTWKDVDPSLALTYQAPATGTVMVTGNADLYTSKAGYNQDIGIAVNGTIVAWKESGGMAAAYSPNAAEVQAAISVTSGVQYPIALRWKTNRNAPGVTIRAGAGPIGGQYSPTRLTVRFVPSGVTVASAAKAYSLTGSDGATWSAIDAVNLTLPASGNCLAALSANADPWTVTAGYNQDLAISVSPLDALVYPGGIAAWKENGGAAGYSPNAAYIQSIVALQPGRSYTVTLLWKSNKSAPGVTIKLGAGSTQISPTTLTAEVSCF